MGKSEGCGCGCSSGKKNLIEVSWSVPAIKCEGCAGKLETTLKAVAGVKCGTVNADAKEVALSFDAAQTSEAQLKDILNTAGFPVVGA
jgi:copper chaperone CopZ